MRGGYVPVDEGEVEAQPAAPVVTIRLLDPQGLDTRPRRVRLEVPAGWGKVAALDALLHEHAVRMLQEQGVEHDGKPVYEWAVPQDEHGRHRMATYTMTGWAQ